MANWIIPTECSSHPAVYVLVALAAFLLTGVSKGGFGGVGILSVPLMMMVAPPHLTLGMWLPLLICCDLFTVRSYPKQWELRPILLLAPWMFAGVVAGWGLLRLLSKLGSEAEAGHWVKVFVGGLSVLFVVLEVVRGVVTRRLDTGTDRPPWRPTWRSTAPFGIAAGISTMLAHSAGAITTIYLLAQRLDQRIFVGTSGRFYFVFNTLKVPFYTLACFELRYITAESLKLSLWLVPLAPVSVWAGSELNKRIAPALFQRIIYGLLAVSGGYLIWANAGVR